MDRESTELLTSGTIVDRYEVERIIGQGGMATVYSVKHTLLGSRHAMKVLQDVHSGVGESLLQEGRLQAKLDPSFVVPVTDVVLVNQVPALVMPFVEGCSLEDLLHSYEPSAGEVASVMAAIAQGIASAHESGIAHRDLKPSNILLDVKHGRVRVRVADFGVAKVERDAEDAPSDLFKGTPEYAAPEQFSDPNSVDGKADLWAMGMILYHMTVGEMPVIGDSPSAIFKTISSGGVKTQRVPELWRDLAMELLEQDPRRRGPDAQDLVERITRIHALSLLTCGSPLSDAIHRAGEEAQERLEREGSQGGKTTVSGTDKRRRNRGIKETEIGSETGKKRAKKRLSREHLQTSSSSISLQQYHLPVSRDAFIGRRNSLEALRDLMSEKHRLVTVLGMGGTGKTRLVARYGHEHLERWPGGVWFCDLKEVRGIRGICLSLAAILGVPVSEGDPVQQLCHVLNTRGRALYIFDNFEQVVEYAEATIGQWMVSCPEAVFLVTSRSVLTLQGETHLHLSPMDSKDSIDLFLDRARRVRPDYRPAFGEMEAIEQLVELLDNLPFAIELAAARIRILTPIKMLEKMSDRFKLLTSRGGVNQTKSTLRGMLDSSWNLLADWEQSALAQLSAFEGGFDLEAAEGILELSRYDEAPWTLDTVQSLVDKSLVRTIGDDRFDLLMSVREYAAEKLSDRSAEEEVYERHGAYYANFGSQEAIESLYSKNGSHAREALFSEFDNLLAALHRGISRDDAIVVTAALRALMEIFERRGPIGMTAELCRKVLETVTLTSEQRGDVFFIRGCAERLMGHYHACIESFNKSLEVRRKGENIRLVGQVQAWLARSLIRVGKDDEAAEAIRESEAIVQQTKSIGDMATMFHHRAIYRSQVGENLGAVSDYKESLKLARQNGNEALEVRILTGLGHTESELGMVEEGRQHLVDALDLVMRLEDPRFEGAVRGDLGIFFHWNGEPERGLALYDAGLELARKVGNRRDESINLVNKGDVHYFMGHREEALQFLQEAVALGRKIWPLVAGVGLGTLGVMFAQNGDSKAAAEAAEEGEGFVRQFGSKLEIGKFIAKKAQVLAYLGKEGDGKVCYDEAMSIYKELGSHEKAMAFELNACRTLVPEWGSDSLNDHDLMDKKIGV